jgi:hypothetical protein
MPSNRVGNVNSKRYSILSLAESGKRTWKELVEDKMKTNESLVGATCHVYSTSVDEPNDQKKICPCGRLARRHSFEGEAQRDEHAAKTTFTDNDFVTVVKPLTAYGQLRQFSNGARVCSIIIIVHS